MTSIINPTKKPTDPLLITTAEVLKLVSFGRTKLNAMVNEKKFPQPIRFSDNFIRWDFAEIKAWVDQQKEILRNG